MKTENIIIEKSYSFALRVIETYKTLRIAQKEFILSKQLLRSGTSIGANIEEAEGAPSKKDFANKLSVSLKESRETRYWLRLLRDSSFLEKSTADSLIDDCDELIRILVSILKTTRNSI